MTICGLSLEAIAEGKELASRPLKGQTYVFWLAFGKTKQKNTSISLVGGTSRTEGDISVQNSLQRQTWGGGGILSKKT